MNLKAICRHCRKKRGDHAHTGNWCPEPKNKRGFSRKVRFKKRSADTDGRIE